MSLSFLVKGFSKSVVASFAFAAVGIGFSGVAQAEATGGFYLEPGVTYQYSNTKTTYPIVSDSTGHTNGFGVLGRAGFHINEMFFVAVDARYGIPQYKDSAFNSTVTAKTWQVGPVVGVQMPDIGLRAWVQYVALGAMDVDQLSNGLKYRMENPTGFQVGVGFRVSMVSLNLEYQNTRYNNANIQNLGSAGAGLTSVKMTNDALIASVSFPLEL